MENEITGEWTGSEEAFQALLFQWFWNTYPEERLCLWHCNNNNINSIAGSAMKAKGVVAGVPDFHYMTRDGRMVFIELKTMTGIQNKQQKLFEDIAIERGHYYFVIRSVGAFKNLIWELIGKR